MDYHVDLETMPMFVRAGSILPYTGERLSTNNRVGPVTRLEAYAGEPSVLHYDDLEKRFTASFDGTRLTVQGLDPEPELVTIG